MEERVRARQATGMAAAYKPSFQIFVWFFRKPAFEFQLGDHQQLPCCLAHDVLEFLPFRFILLAPPHQADWFQHVVLVGKPGAMDVDSPAREIEREREREIVSSSEKKESEGQMYREGYLSVSYMAYLPI